MALGSSVSQKEYLKKYLSDVAKKKKKKKGVQPSVGIKRSKIIDDDIDLKSMRPLDDDEVELYQLDDDAPQIAGIVDERPPEVKAQEYYNPKRWKVFGGEDGVSVVDSMEKNLKQDSANLSESSKSVKTKDKSEGVRKTESVKKDTSVNETKLSKEKVHTKRSNSDNSPPRDRKQDASSKDTNQKPKKSSSSDSDESPQRLKKPRDDSDSTPPRRDRNPPRHRYDSDNSPPRNHQKKKHNAYHADSDESPLRRDSRKRSPKHIDSSLKSKKERNRNRSDSDTSPPRKRSDARRSNYKSDSDNSPPRKEKKRFKKHKTYSDSDTSPPRKTKRPASDSDSSLPRRNWKKSNSPGSSKRSRSTTPVKPAFFNRPTLTLKTNKIVSPRLSRRDLMDKNIKRRFSDSDDSPPRRRSISFTDGGFSDLSPSRKKKSKSLKKAMYKPNDSSSSDERRKSKSKKMKTTLDGKHAGLQDAKELRKELSDLKMKEDLMFSKMEASVSGVGAAPIKRDRKTGQVRDMDKEREAQKEKEAKASVINEKYYKWGKGVKQVEDAAERAAEALREMSKPLARYADDNDLDTFLKAQEREGDPMLDFIKQKQKEATPLVGEKPIYKGSYNPNRFGIRPGHRWDGVVRSSGYEKEWFTHQNARKARNEEAYKWSTSDM